jgi:arylformamidase
VAPKSRTVRFSRIVDLSQPIGPDTQMFPGYPAPTFTQWTTREVHGFFAESMFLVSHTGTHVDAPFHFEPTGRKLHEMPLDRFIAPGHVLDLPGLPKKGKILPRHLRSSLEESPRPVHKGDAILLRTRWWERHRGTPAYLFQNPGVTEAAAELLLDWGAGLVGTDTANIDVPDDGTYPAHHTLLGANVPVIENVANLEVLGSSPFLLLALPLNLQGTSGSPIRLVALAE